MNLIVICIDTLRYDHLGCNGNDWIRTPNLDAFAAESLVFDNAYLGSFPTIPHRTDCFKGRFGEPLHPWLPLGFDDSTLPAILGRAGWATYLVFDTPHLISGGHGFDYPFHGWHFERGNEVDQHIIDDLDPDRLSFPDGVPERFTRHLTRTYAQYVRNNRGRRLEEEWPSPRVFRAAGDFVEMNRARERYFLWVDCFDPHEPWDPPEHYVALYDGPDLDRDRPLWGWDPLELLTPEQLVHTQAHYAGEVTMVDRHFGRFMDRLAASGRDRDTAVIVTCDHGTNLGSHGRLSKGGPIYEQVGHVVLMARVPGVSAGRRPQMVQPADLMPTLLDLVDVPVPATCQGRSFASLIRGTDSGGRAVAVSGGAIDVARVSEAYLTVQDERWCLIDWTDPARRELRDKTADREEEHNVLAAHPQHEQRLHQSLVQFLKDHRAHPSLVSWYESGQRGDTTGYQHRDPYLEKYVPYFTLALSE